MDYLLLMLLVTTPFFPPFLLTLTVSSHFPFTWVTEYHLGWRRIKSFHLYFFFFFRTHLYVSTLPFKFSNWWVPFNYLEIYSEFYVRQRPVYCQSLYESISCRQWSTTHSRTRLSHRSLLTYSVERENRLIDERKTFDLLVILSQVSLSLFMCFFPLSLSLFLFLFLLFFFEISMYSHTSVKYRFVDVFRSNHQKVTHCRTTLLST